MMKSLRSPLSMLIFLAFAGTGFLIGRLSAAGLGLHDLPAPLLAQTSSPKTGSLTTQQRRVLLISVDSLDSPSPRLAGVWMGFYLLDAPRFTLAPVYPLAPADAAGLAFQDELAAAFGLEPGGGFPSRFTIALQSRQITWDAYVLADQTAAAGLIRYLAEGAGAASTPPPPDLPTPQQAAGDPASASQAQAEWLQGLCRLAGRFPAEAGLQPVLRLIPAHLRTDLDPAQAAAEWLRLRQAGAVTCEFPTLSRQPTR